MSRTFKVAGLILALLGWLPAALAGRSLSAFRGADTKLGGTRSAYLAGGKTDAPAQLHQLRFGGMELPSVRIVDGDSTGPGSLPSFARPALAPDMGFLAVSWIPHTWRFSLRAALLPRAPCLG